MKILILCTIPTKRTQIAKISKDINEKIVTSFLKVKTKKNKKESEFFFLNQVFCIIIYKPIQKLNNLNRPFKQSLML